MSQELVITILTILIPASVTIGGLAINYMLTKRNFHEEVSKYKVNIRLEKTAELPHEIQLLIDDITRKTSRNNQKINQTDVLKYQKILSAIFSYCSKEAIALAADMQNYFVSDSSQNADKTVPYLVLLLCQIKFDITGIEINPDFWYKMRLSDYKDLKDKYATINNEIVDKLGLNQSFKMR